MEKTSKMKRTKRPSKEQETVRFTRNVSVDAFKALEEMADSKNISSSFFLDQLILEEYEKHKKWKK